MELYFQDSLLVPQVLFGEIVFNTGMTGYQEVITDLVILDKY